MNEEDIFQKLKFGLRFDQKSGIKTIQRFKTSVSKPIKIENVKPSLELDFFQKNRKLKKSRSLDAEDQPKIIAKVDKNSNTKKETSTKTGVSQKKRKSTESLDKNNPPKKKKTENKRNLRKLHKIYVEGSDIPELITNFEQLQSIYHFNETCLKNIVENMGFETMTPIQMQAIPALLHGREILACAPTGSGKTLCFLIPVLHHLLSVKKKKKTGFRGLIISPTKELAEQTLRECRSLIAQEKNENETSAKKTLLNVKVLDKKETKAYMQAGAVHSKKTDLLICTPNRLICLLQHDPPLISLKDVEWLIVDESDKLFEEGKENYSFRDQLGTIYSACTNTKVRRCMFSATFAYDVQQWCIMNMDNVLQVTVGGRNVAVETVDQELRYVGNEQGKLLALRQIIQQGFGPPVLIFVQSKERAKELFVELIYDGKNIDAIHSDRSPLQRENAVKAFRRGDTWVLICTEILGRGMDFKGVNLVINYDFPTSAISYIHRIGRTGRAGRKGRAITFFTDEDKPMLKSIANVVRLAGCEVPKYMLKFKKLGRRELRKMPKKEIKRRTIRTGPRKVVKKKKTIKKKSKSQNKS